MRDESRIYYELEGISPKKYAKVGQHVYIIPAGNMTRGLKGSLLNHATEGIIKSIGNKLITLENGNKFVAECGYIRENSNYSNSNLILSDDDFEKAKELSRIHNIIGKFFDMSYNSTKFNRVSFDDKIKITEILQKYID